MQAKEHFWEPKGWGGESWIVNNEKYCGKILHIQKGKRFSLHYHKLKTETFYISKGEVQLEYCFKKDDEGINKFVDGKRTVIKNSGKESNVYFGLATIVLEEGDSFHLPPYTIHRITGLRSSEVIEFSTQHFESDSYRIEKGD